MTKNSVNTGKIGKGKPPKEKQFKPGQSGNPNGRPKGVPNSSTRLLRLLELEQKMKNPVTGKDESFTVAEQMDMALINKARKGDVQAYREIMDRLEGKVKQPTEISGPNGAPIETNSQHTVIFKRMGSGDRSDV